MDLGRRVLVNFRPLKPVVLNLGARLPREVTVIPKGRTRALGKSKNFLIILIKLAAHWEKFPYLMFVFATHSEICLEDKLVLPSHSGTPNSCPYHLFYYDHDTVDVLAVVIL